MKNELSYFEASKLGNGTRIRFSRPYDLMVRPFPVIEAGSTGVVEFQWLNELSSILVIQLDDPAYRKALADWNGEGDESMEIPGPSGPEDIIDAAGNPQGEWNLGCFIEVDGKRKCAFAFDDGPAFDGFTDDTTWNGALNVWITDVERELVVEWLRNTGEDQSADDIMAIPVVDGLVSLANGYTTHEVTDDAEI